MHSTIKFTILLCAGLALTSCVAKKKYTSLQSELAAANKDLGKCGESLNEALAKLTTCEKDKENLRSELSASKNTLQLREEQIRDLRAQIEDFKAQRDKQLDLRAQIEDFKAQRDKQLAQVGNLTVLSQSANENIKETLAQLERKDKYIHLLQAAKTKADSINLALAVNLKSVLKDGIEDEDVEVKVDKTVVFVNLSDKMLFQSGSYNLTTRANEVLGKIAQIVQSRPEVEVMVEGYTDNVPIKNACIDDNWDLSVKRSTSVVRALQKNFRVDPNRLIAAGRGEYNTLASNDTEAGRATNRRTRIIILPKLDQFYDLLNPNNMPNK